jgi:cellulose synthase operon protein YhjQ
MDSHGTDRIDDPAVAETPEDVAVLYSWANLHGAKYRDFSASRREYRAQLRHRAAQQVREQALLAQAEAENAAAEAELAARQAVEAAQSQNLNDPSDSFVQRSLREAEEAARTAAAERVEAARRAEAAAVAEATARREEREIAEAHASAARQAARYADSEIRRRASAGMESDSPKTPGQMSDPYTAQPSSPPHGEPVYQRQTASVERQAASAGESYSSGDRVFREYADYSSTSAQPERRVPVQQVVPRRPQGYRPDDASGVRQIYRGPDHETPKADYPAAKPVRLHVSSQSGSRPVAASSSTQSPDVRSQDMKQIPEPSTQAQHRSPVADGDQAPAMGKRRTDALQQQQSRVRPAQDDAVMPPPFTERRELIRDAIPERRDLKPAASIADRPQAAFDPVFGPGAGPATESNADALPAAASVLRQPVPRPSVPVSETPSRAVSPFSQALVPSDSTRGRRAQDDFDYQQSQAFPERERRSILDPAAEPAVTVQRTTYAAPPAGPAWLYAPPAASTPQKPTAFQTPPAQSSVADTLQHSRERVAARWFALKGVFEQPGQEQPEAAPVRQKETRTPVLAVFSLAGGVGKTSLVATVGRALSSMGEKVLLTDTTSHGLLPFYFGASELRPGAVRTFSPPSGSTDAPIYLVSYDVDERGGDEAAQDLLAEEIIENSRGTHRILLDLTASSSWIVRRMARMNPTILVPVAPDMNSVISLQTVEKFFHGVNDGDGRPLQPFYVLNQFDTSLPLHLDVREVLRRQLGERLLPFVIRRAPAVSEALAEGMTVIDYAPDAAVADDYSNVATWLRTVAAPATAGFRNVRWSER